MFSSNKPINEVTIALKFLHEARFNISYQFDRDKNTERISLKLSCNEIGPDHNIKTNSLSTIIL